MCDFFSFLTDGEGKMYYFDPKQRRERVTFADGSSIDSYDSHTSIATYYGFKGEKEDTLNKWEYNPFTDKLILDTQNTADDRNAFIPKLRALDWNGLAGDIDAIKTLLASIGAMKFFDSHGELPEGTILFDTRAAAWDAARDAARGGAGAAAWDAARDAAWDAAWDAALLARIHVCAGLNIDQKHIDHVKLRWSVYEEGYSVAADVNGVLYCYKSVA